MRKGLKKIRKSIRGKGGKASMRSYWVKSQAQKLKKGSVLASFNHPGPNAGSDHSWLAHLTGAYKDRARGDYASHEDHVGPYASWARQQAGNDASHAAKHSVTYGMLVNSFTPLTRANHHIEDSRKGLAAAFDVPRSHVTYHGRGRK